MKTFSTTTLVLPALLCLAAGCGGKDGGSLSPRPSSSPRTTTAGATTQDAIPSQQEYDSQATKKINTQNADSEYDKLKKEIEGDG